ncbi:MAG: heparinase II/III family protein, partial [Planctomycetota bacterium]|nr:heparinase II/III family protein [Planctomycetota bacterium]
LELIGYDPTLKPLNPEGRMLHGHAFAANTMCVSSRTNWNPLATPCVVYGKGGAAYEVHGHHDVGQVCIDGFGKRLIVDAGGYASNNKEFYAASSHNVLTFNGQDMIEDRPKSRACFDQAEIRDRPALRAKLLASEFDDKRGGYWVLDTTDVYEGVAQARRMVVHLNPGVVVVLDTAALDKPGDISLRWHTADKCKPDAGGRFVVRSGRNISLESQVSHLGDEALAVARGEHQETRAGYVEASLRATRCTLLTLFCVSDPSKEAQRWKGSKGSWSIQTAEGVVDVRVSNTELSVAYRNILSGWRIRRSGK